MDPDDHDGEDAGEVAQVRRVVPVGEPPEDHEEEQPGATQSHPLVSERSLGPCIARGRERTGPTGDASAAPDDPTSGTLGRGSRERG